MIYKTANLQINPQKCNFLLIEVYNILITKYLKLPNCSISPPARPILGTSFGKNQSLREDTGTLPLGRDRRRYFVFMWPDLPVYRSGM